MFEVAVEPLFNFLSGDMPSVRGLARDGVSASPLVARDLSQTAAGSECRAADHTVRRDNRLMMLLPFVRRRYGTLRAIEFADFGVSDYASAIASDAASQAIAADRGACARIKAALKPFDVLRIPKLREDALPMERLSERPSASRCR